MSEVKVNKVTPRSGTTLTIGDSGDTTNVVGTLQNNGAALVGDISSVVAGTNLSGGGTSGAVTINLADASTSAKGAASFSSDNFAASSGAVTIKDLGVATGEIQDNAITLAKMASGTDGNIISYDTSGNPVAVATGSATQVLTSAGAGAPPVFATATVPDNAITLAKMASGTDGNIISYDTSGNPVAVATGSSGQVLTSAGAGAVPTFADAAGGAFTLLSTTTISSAVSAVDITSNIDSTYRNYMFVATDIHVSNDDRNILLRVFSADGSPDTTTNCFHYAGVGRTTGGTLLGKNSGGGNNQAEVNILEQGNAAAEKSDFIMYMYNPSGTTHHKGFYTLSNLINSAGLFVNGTMSQSYRKTIAITGVRFFPNAGTIESGQIKLYGIS